MIIGQQSQGESSNQNVNPVQESSGSTDGNDQEISRE